MTSASFARMARIMCARKRRLMAGTTNTLSGLLCTPKAPVDMDTRKSLGLEAPHVVYEVHLQGAPDILKGDVLTMEAQDFSIQYTEPWVWLPTNDKRLRLVIEDLTNNAV